MATRKPPTNRTPSVSPPEQLNVTPAVQELAKRIQVMRSPASTRPVLKADTQTVKAAPATRTDGGGGGGGAFGTYGPNRVVPNTSATDTTDSKNNVDTDGDGVPDAYDPAAGVKGPEPAKLPKEAIYTPVKVDRTDLESTPIIQMKETAKAEFTPFGPDAKKKNKESKTKEMLSKIQKGSSSTAQKQQPKSATAQGQSRAVSSDEQMIEMTTGPVMVNNRTRAPEPPADTQPPVRSEPLTPATTTTTTGTVSGTGGLGKSGDATIIEDIQTAEAPEDVTATTYDPTLVSEDVETATAQQGEVSPEAIVDFEEQTLTERAVAAERDLEAEQAALSGLAEYDLSADAFVDPVTGEIAQVSETPEAEVKSREAITGVPATDGQAAEIIGMVGYEAASMRTVKGTAAKGAAAQMVAEVGALPEDLSATIVEDPQSVEAQLDDEPIEIRAAVAALPTEALVSSQMETLLGGLEDGEIPMWARPAVDAVNQQMAQRGLLVSTVGRDALFNAIIQTALPMAQSNALALQERSALNLTNEQQARVQTANLEAQRRLQNTANRQTATSQTAQLAQQMSVLQSQFSQETMMTSAQLQQQTSLQNLQNRQQAALQNVQNQQAMNAQNLSNEQQTELANLQYEFQTNAANMSAENVKRLNEMQVAADFMAKNAGFKQQMELANLSNDQQMRLANLSALNQASADNLNAAQQTELANLNARMQTNLLQAQIASNMNVAQLNADQQRAVQNASMIANMDMAKFNADQQVQLANSKFMQTMVLSDFNAEQQAAMQNATALASLDLANLDNRTRIAAQNAAAFLQMDMTNLNNRQQTEILNAQMKQQALLSDQSMTNAAAQFNAQSQNQVDQFNASMAAQISQFNAAQINAMNQFNAQSINQQTIVDKENKTRIATANIAASATVSAASISAGAAVQSAQIRADSSERIANATMELQASQFNASQEFAREQFNAANAQAIAQADTAWARQLTLAETAAQNAANQQNAQNAFAMTMQQQQNAWQEARDSANYLRQSYENEQTRKTQLYAVALGNETAAGNSKSTTINGLMGMIDNFFGGG